MVRRLFQWLRSEDNRGALAVLAGGAAAAVAGGWAVWLYLYPDRTPQRLEIETVRTICYGRLSDKCPAGAPLVACGGSIEAAAAAACGNLLHEFTRQLRAEMGGSCGFALYEVTCRASN